MKRPPRCRVLIRGKEVGEPMNESLLRKKCVGGNLREWTKPLANFAVVTALTTD